MKLEQPLIPGEVDVESHRDWIALSSVSEGLRLIGGDGSSGASRARSQFVFDGVMVAKDMDISTPELRRAIVEGTFFGEVKIDVVKSCGGTNVYTAYAITLSPARIVNLTLAATADGVPTETVGFEYTRITTMYTPVDKDCKIHSPLFSTQDGELLELR